MLLIIDSSFLTTAGIPEWAMISSNSCVWAPSLLPSFRKVRGRPQNLLSLPINGNTALTTLGPSWSRSDYNDSTGATGKAYLYSIFCHLQFVPSQNYSNSSWSEASDRPLLTDWPLSALMFELFIHHLLQQLFLVNWRNTLPWDAIIARIWQHLHMRSLYEH